MYDELIKALRNCANPDKCCEDCGFFDKCYKSTENFSIEEQAADAIEKLEIKLAFSKGTERYIASKVPKWIPVTERLPDVGEFVLIYRHEDVVSRQRLFIDVMVTSNTTDIPYWHCNDGRVLYWMPLPEFPME